MFHSIGFGFSHVNSRMGCVDQRVPHLLVTQTDQHLKTLMLDEWIRHLALLGQACTHLGHMCMLDTLIRKATHTWRELVPLEPACHLNDYLDVIN